MFRLFDDKAFLPDPTLIRILFAEECLVCAECCTNIIELFLGRSATGAYNESRMDVVVAHEPGVTSVKNMVHWAQQVRSKLFQRYDYGTQGNMIEYGQSTAPLYNVSDISRQIPIVVFWGGKDELADPQDVAWLIPQIPNLVYVEELPTYAHVDFVWDTTAHLTFYPTLEGYLKQFAQSKKKIVEFHK